jgi:metal-responsive CopG/Arc/MetJ family transcriptional regulator
MKRTAVFLTDEQLADLQAVYRATGAKPSESIRRAINAYLEGKKAEIKEGKQGKKNG